MSEVLLTVEKRDDGLRYVTYGGRDFALATEPQFQADYRYDYRGYSHIPAGTRYKVSFDFIELPPPPPKPQKRSVARSYGLRKPQ